MSDVVVEVTVILKDSERTFRQKSLCYERIRLDPRDATIQRLIQEAMENFQGEPDDISIKCSMEVQ